MIRELIDGANGRMITVVRNGPVTYLKAGQHDHEIDSNNSDIILINIDDEMTEILNYVSASISYRKPDDAWNRSISFLRRMTASRGCQLGMSGARGCCREAVI